MCTHYPNRLSLPLRTTGDMQVMRQKAAIKGFFERRAFHLAIANVLVQEKIIRFRAKKNRPGGRFFCWNLNRSESQCGEEAIGEGQWRSLLAPGVAGIRRSA